ncbi:FAD:protein FMN transferase [Niveispirillum sp. KHB5.9]|uniref:FAD:protein FMN transferase n=1 Tax=Niveispirillum sp. KHB5.9 TaxID=3400269 RepID=UPI003A8C3773
MQQTAPHPDPIRLILPADAPEAALPPATAPVVRLSGTSLGTYWSVAIIAPKGPEPLALRRGIIAILDRVIASMSHWDASSALCRYNAADRGWVDGDADLIKVLSTALSVAADSGGAYDPAIGGLVDEWGFGPPGPVDTPPDAARIAALLSGPRWRDIKVGDGRLWQPGGVRLDFSAIAKGYAVDLVSRYLAERGVVSHLVDIGGELRGWGIKHDATPWWVTLEQAVGRDGQPGGLPTRIALHGWAVATSGDSRRFMAGADGQRLSHSLDPRTGRPVPDDLAAVTVLHADCMMADVLATALTVLGPDHGLDWAAARGIMALFVCRDGAGITETLTPALAALAEEA